MNLPNGIQPFATLTGSTNYPILNFGLERGEIGLTPIISFGTITDLPNGTPSSATITGTTNNPILNFNLQQGLHGNSIKGDPGDPGPRGHKGDDGDTTAASAAAGWLRQQH